MKLSGFTKRALTTIGIAGIVSLASATSAFAAQFTFPYTANPQNSCTGDTMLFNGTTHVVFDVTTNADGSSHVIEHMNTEGVTAVGIESGDEYVISEVTNDTQEFDVGPTPADSHTVHNLVVIHKANNLPNDDRYEHVVVDTTWVNGVPTPTIHAEREECQ